MPPRRHKPAIPYAPARSLGGNTPNMTKYGVIKGVIKGVIFPENVEFVLTSVLTSNSSPSAALPKAQAGILAFSPHTLPVARLVRAPGVSALGPGYCLSPLP